MTCLYDPTQTVWRLRGPFGPCDDMRTNSTKVRDDLWKRDFAVMSQLKQTNSVVIHGVHWGENPPDSSCCWQRAWWYFRLSLHSCFAPASDSLYTSTCFMFNSSHASLIAEETWINTSNNIITSKYVHAQRAVIRKCVFIITAVFSNICFPKIFTAIFSTTTVNKNTITYKH